MSCPSTLRSRPAAAAFLGDVSHARHLGAAGRRLLARLRQDEGRAEFGRFVLVGCAATLVYGLLFLVLGRFGYLPAHLAATAASTVLANELHRQLTFRAESRVSWLFAQVEAGGVAFGGLLATSAALGWVHSSTDDVPVILQVTLVTAITAAVGLGRFLALRWIFRPTAPPAAR